LSSKIKEVNSLKRKRNQGHRRTCDEEEIITRLAQKAKEVFEAGRVVLIIGVMSKNIGRWQEIDDPRLVFWYTGETRHTVPENVGLIIRTRFGGHPKTRQMRATLHKKLVEEPSLFIQKEIHTGQIKRILCSSYTPLAPKPKKTIQPAPIILVQERKEEMSQPVVVTPTPVAPHSDSVEILKNFGGNLDTLQGAIENVLEDNDALRGRVKELEEQLTNHDKLVELQRVLEEALQKSKL
jgi:hypothetical protein